MNVKSLYAARPLVMKDLRLGQWFCNAFKLQDNQLYYLTDNEHAASIIRENYNTYDLSFLQRYNLSFKETIPQ